MANLAEIHAAARLAAAKAAVMTRPGGTPPGHGATPAILDWAKRQFTEEEAVAGLREIRETGGLELRDFLHELDEPAAPNDRPAQ